MRTYIRERNRKSWLSVSVTITVVHVAFTILLLLPDFAKKFNRQSMLGDHMKYSNNYLH